MDLLTWLGTKVGLDFPWSSLWWSEDGSLPYLWVWGPKPWGGSSEPISLYDNEVLTRFTALRFPG